MDKILGIGNALVDVMTVIDDDKILDIFSLPKGSMQLVDATKSALIKENTSLFKRTLSSGGSVANTMHGIGMLGAECGYIGSVGNDDTGDFFENDMKMAGVKTFLSRRKTVTGTAVALISADSERTFATHLGAAVELIADELNPADFRDYKILYVEGYLIVNKELIDRACSIAKKNNMKIAIDLSSYNVVEAKLEDFKEIIEKYVDVIFANEDEAKAFTGKAPYEALLDLSALCETAVVKTGKEGSYLKRGEEIVKVGTLSVDCIDTTGAGDLYASGFLYGYASGMSLEQCGLIGSILAGHVIEIVGAKMDDQRWKKILNLVKEQASYQEE
jgi:sugar/nucleoside kinase (ribokinase family)